MVTWTQAVGGPPPHPAAWLAVSRAPNPRPPLLPPLVPAPRAADQETELLRQHLEPQQRRQPFQRRQRQGRGGQEEEEEELGG